jgi:hypothetical protein
VSCSAPRLVSPQVSYCSLKFDPSTGTALHAHPLTFCSKIREVLIILLLLYRTASAFASRILPLLYKQRSAASHLLLTVRWNAKCDSLARLSILEEYRPSTTKGVDFRAVAALGVSPEAHLPFVQLGLPSSFAEQPAMASRSFRLPRSCLLGP